MGSIIILAGIMDFIVAFALGSTMASTIRLLFCPYYGLYHGLCYGHSYGLYYGLYSGLYGELSYGFSSVLYKGFSVGSAFEGLLWVLQWELDSGLYNRFYYGL